MDDVAYVPQSGPGVYALAFAELEARIATTDDAVEKGRPRALLEGVVGVGREMAVDVLAKVITNRPP